MIRLKRSMLWACLIVIAILAALSVYGAFLGADRAQDFFSSVPVAVFWGAFAVLLGAGIIAFRRLLWVPSLLLMHLGCILVVLGGMWGSKPGQDFQKRFLGTERIHKGQMPILEGTSENRVALADSNDTKELPFSIRLRKFRIEYYEPGDLFIYSRDGRRWKLPAEAGRSQKLGRELGMVTIHRVFRNFKMDVSGDERMAVDAPGGANPALEVAIERPDGSTAKRYVFLQRAGHNNPNDPLALTYTQSVRDYISELEVVRDNEVVTSKEIEVNHPLYYGGYHFYQHKYGQNQLGDYTILMVVADSGLRIVYSGYAMLMVGIVWHFGGRPLRSALRNRRSNERDGNR